MINWKVRVKNKAFWVTFIPAVLLLIQLVAQVFGFAIELDTLKGQLLAVLDVVFTILTLFGIVNDPTTAGISDSTQAMGYDKPKEE